jgi:P27 family predicted phage terminase small subunit
MGIGGKKPTPRALKSLKGTAKAPKQSKGLQAPQTLDSPPDFFGPDELSEWGRVQEYALMGVIRAPDYGTCVGLAVLFGNAMDAARDVSENGLTMETPNGMTQQRATVSTMRNAFAAYRQFASELGLTPTSRTRLDIPAPKTETAMSLLLNEGAS